MTATLTLDLFRPSILEPADESHDDAPPNVAQPSIFAPAEHPEADPTPERAVHGQTPSEQGGGLTFDDIIVGVWEGLSAHRTVACPACGEAMTPRYSAGPAPVGGRCTSCGTTIA
jgi:hypothetical protein